MDLNNINKNTFYIKGGTNTGVYITKNNECILIDPGLSGLRPKSIVKLLQLKNLTPIAIINTHEHDDHYAGSKYIIDMYPNIKTYSSEHAKLNIENPELFTKYILSGRSNKILDNKFRMKSTEKVNIDYVVEEGELCIENSKFTIYKLNGHTSGSIGILTEDKVFFVGDLLVGEKMLEKYDFLFMYDIEEYFKSLEKVKHVDYDYMMVGHSLDIMDKQKSLEVIEKHKQAMYKYMKQVLEILETPSTVEEILSEIITYNNLSCNYVEYHFFKSSLVSLISYFVNLDKVTYKIEKGKLLYYTKNI